MLSRLNFSYHLAVTCRALISGCKLYVGTLGEGTRILFPRERLFLTAAKEKVTWAYFSVSAIRSCRSPAAATTSPKVCRRYSGGKATGAFIVSSYCVMQTKRGNGGA